jgi:hypothetical protein
MQFDGIQGPVCCGPDEYCGRKFPFGELRQGLKVTFICA